MATAQQLRQGDVGGNIGMTPLRYATLPEPDLQEVFLDIIQQTPFLIDALNTAEKLALPNWRLVAGALYNTVWNHLTGRPATHGINDVDLMYFDPDTSWQAEDTIIGNATGFPENPPVEEAIDVFASKTHSVGVRLQNGALDLYAPYGLRDIFAMRVVPSPIRHNRATHETKAKRALQMWPELTIVPWT